MALRQFTCNNLCSIKCKTHQQERKRVSEYAGGNIKVKNTPNANENMHAIYTTSVWENKNLGYI